MTTHDDAERMSDVDAVIWTVERDPRLRSTIVAVAVFDGPLDRSGLRHRIERASRVVPRLRQHVVAEPLRISPPRWEADPDFSLAFHLRMATLGGHGTRRELYDLAATIAAQPFDRARPLWEITHVEGLSGGDSALILKSHHAISDGIGGVELSLEIFDLAPEPDPARDHLPPLPSPPPRRPRLQSALRHEAREVISSARVALDSLIGAGDDLQGAARRVGEIIGSATRQLRPSRGPMSHTMTGRSLEIGFDGFSVPLDGLRSAGRRVDGTINDAFVTAVALGLSAYHRRHDDSLAVLRMAIPVSRRRADDDLGNHWAPGRLEVDVDSDQPDEIMAGVRDRMRRLREEPAHDLLDPLAAVLRRMPSGITSSLLSSITTGIDVAASNVPGSPVPLFLLGRAVTELMPFGPLSGAATNVTLLSHAADAHIGVNRDRAAVPDGEALGADLRDGFDRVLR